MYTETNESEQFLGVPRYIGTKYSSRRDTILAMVLRIQSPKLPRCCFRSEEPMNLRIACRHDNMIAYRLIDESMMSPSQWHFWQAIHSEMKCPTTNLVLFVSLAVSLWIACPAAAAGFSSKVLSDLINGSSSSVGLLETDDPRFAVAVSQDETDLPATPVLMNVVELLAQYAAMDYSGRTRGRHGTVMESYPQIEIAVLPAGPSTSVEIRLVIWAIYRGVIEIIHRKMFKQSDITFTWDDRVVGNVYITRPLDDVSGSRNFTDSAATPMLENSTNLDSSIGRFGWIPIYTPNAQTLPPQDVFILAMSIIKIIAQHPIDDKVEGAFHMGSTFANAHMEVYLQERRSPRTRPPYFQYSHLLEAVRRIPAWMLQNRRFADMYASISSASRGVGHVLMAKGPFNPRPSDIARGITIS